MKWMDEKQNWKLYKNREQEKKKKKFKILGVSELRWLCLNFDLIVNEKKIINFSTTAQQKER